jgi:MFS family permease
MRGRIYTFIFFLTLAEALVFSVLSPHLLTFISEEQLGYFYTVISLFVILGLSLMPHLVGRYGHKRVFFWLIGLGAIGAFATAFGSGSTAIAAVALYIIIPQIAPVINDLYLDKESRRSERGVVMGSAYSYMNLAFVVGPLIAGYILVDNNYHKLFIVAGVAFLVAAWILNQFVDKIPAINLHHGKMWKGLAKVWKNKDVRNVLFLVFILQIFFSWMVIYTPIYLMGSVGLPLSSLGAIFSIMLLPYVLLEYPLGRIADLYIGEKEMLFLGFTLMAITTGTIPFLHSSSLMAWAVILFGTRVGAAMVESMTATYFNKKINPEDFDLLALFRDMRPVGYIIGPLVAAYLFPNIYPLSYLFPILAVIMICGAFFSLSLKDTK